MKFIKLNIELTQVKVPNKRTILIPADYTMINLHNCIQTLYWLFNYHLRDFCRNAKGKKRILVQSKDEIEATAEEYWLSPDTDYLEAEKVTIADFFNEENKKAVYNYDYWANNERIVTYKWETEKDWKYPVCLKSIWHLIIEDEPSWMSEEWHEIYEKNDKKAFDKKNDEFGNPYKRKNFKDMMAALYEDSDCETLSHEMYFHWDDEINDLE